jgi:hypothetical protein
MKRLVAFSALGVALAAGAPANAQAVITREIIDQPVEAIVIQQPNSTALAEEPLITTPSAETVEAFPVETVTTTTVRTLRRPVRRRAESRVANTITTTTKRTYYRDRVVVGAAVSPAVETLVEPYTEMVEAPAIPYDHGPFYDIATPPAMNALAAGSYAPTIYRYVYEPDRILVVDPYTNVVVQAIPQ